MQKRGLVLVVGATGSGKTTSIAAMLDYRNSEKSGHILTLEDPVEFIFQNKKSIVNQREVGTDTKAFEIALKNALRQAPDCILIGEIRDKQTMAMALAYAQSGHLCLATLHANNSYHAMNRVINFYPLENRPSLLLDLSAALQAVISQRLVRTKDGKRVAAVEVLLNTRHVSELIEKGEINEIKEALEKSMAPGSQTFEQALFKLFMDGKITQDEAMANADSATNMLWLINQATAGEISGQAIPPKPAAPAPEKSGEKSGGEEKKGVLAAGNGASFGEIKIDMNA
jgi:twitching motility protein PilU